MAFILKGFESHCLDWQGKAFALSDSCDVEFVPLGQLPQQKKKILKILFFFNRVTLKNLSLV